MPVTAHTNRLIHEKSPYLLQHAHNPVDWYSWGDEAFAKAKAEDKPVFLSIGYSTCHWCHVMEHESFEDEEVAAYLNQNFISIKVDREERPDVDAFYMDACMALTGSGGWPLSCFLTHGRKPFFAGTYFPKHDGLYGMGFLSLLAEIHRVWQNRRDDLLESADSISLHIDEPMSDAELKPGRSEAAFHHLESVFDSRYGGFGSAPKFPALQNLLFLIRYGWKHQEQKAYAMGRKTLDSMAEGGICDHIGGGFCRYSTDRQWLVPHFEKMMVDNALHILVYSEAAALFGNQYAETASRVTQFCMREMLGPDGGFYTAMDADSGGEEGKFYVFSPDEILQVLGKKDGERCCKLYHITPEGNFEGKSIPNTIGSGLKEEDAAFAKRCSELLLQYRGGRTPPFRDDKVTAMVNGLMIAALAVEGHILQDGACIEAAERCASFLLSSLVRSGRLMNRWRSGESGVPASSDDYACLIWGLIELYEATFKPEWLRQAVLFTEKMDVLFRDSENGGYFLTGSDIKDLPIRQKNFQDAAMPSGNAVMAMNLLRLSRICAKESYAELANGILKQAAPLLNSQPSACCGLLCSLLYLEDGGTEVVLAGGEGFNDLQKGLPVFSPFLSSAACGNGFDILDVAPYLKEYGPVDGKAAAYICRNGTCRKPEISPEKLRELLTYGN